MREIKYIRTMPGIAGGVNHYRIEGIGHEEIARVPVTALIERDEAEEIAKVFLSADQMVELVKLIRARQEHLHMAQAGSFTYAESMASYRQAARCGKQITKMANMIHFQITAPLMRDV